MLFNSLTFVGFFLVVFGLYACLRHRGQNRLLLVASYVFYGAWDYRFLLLLWFTTLVDYAVGLGLASRQDPRARKQLITLSICMNLGVLAIFKYFNFFAESFTDFAAMFGWQVSPVTLRIVLPVGISFYTFQSMSYTIDVYRRRLEPSRKLMDFALFVAFFPQLMAGPIERATQLLPRVLNPRVMTREKIGSGLVLVLIGYFKKVVVADNLAITVNAIFGQHGPYTAEQVIIGALFFAFQIYGDFSGYTDIARGIARMLGFELMTNFREPYFARNPSDFWRRWHISLSSWLRDYLYIPLGGNRNGRWQTYRNLMLTMVLGGLWHGAAWNFVLWGFYQGAMLAGHKLFTDLKTAKSNVTRFATARAAGATALMFVFTLYGWLLFRARSFEQIEQMTTALTNFHSFSYLLQYGAKLAFFIWPVVLLDYLKFRSSESGPVLLRAPLVLQAACYAAFMILFVIFGRFEGASFIYFQF